jgi:hypothetical protein
MHLRCHTAGKRALRSGVVASHANLPEVVAFSCHEGRQRLRLSLELTQLTVASVEVATILAKARLSSCINLEKRIKKLRL